jgi:hypothetical protein
MQLSFAIRYRSPPLRQATMDRRNRRNLGSQTTRVIFCVQGIMTPPRAHVSSFSRVECSPVSWQYRPPSLDPTRAHVERGGSHRAGAGAPCVFDRRLRIPSQSSVADSCLDIHFGQLSSSRARAATSFAARSAISARVKLRSRAPSGRSSNLLPQGNSASPHPSPSMPTISIPNPASPT